MTLKPRIYISSPMPEHLQPHQISVRKRIINAIISQNFAPQEFLTSGELKSTPWTFEASSRIMSHCNGAIVLAFARWASHLPTGEQVILSTEYNHFEGALAIARKLPLLVVKEDGVVNRGIVWMGGGLTIAPMPVSSSSRQTYQRYFDEWCSTIKSRPQVFLGYCGQARSTADAVTLHLERTIGIKVRNYAMDFHSGRTILEEIERSAEECTCGIFLFTKDDELAGEGITHAAPRDNVVFEAGYFMHAKGKERTLIIREEGAKMPADVGGNIYINLKNRDDISTIHEQLRLFLEKNL